MPDTGQGGRIERCKIQRVLAAQRAVKQREITGQYQNKQYEKDGFKGTIHRCLGLQQSISKAICWHVLGFSAMQFCCSQDLNVSLRKQRRRIAHK